MTIETELITRNQFIFILFSDRNKNFKTVYRVRAGDRLQEIASTFLIEFPVAHPGRP